MKKSIFYLFPVSIFFVVVTLNFGSSAAISKEPTLRAEPLDGGTIKGIVKFPEDYPETEKVTITKNQAVCGAFQYSESFVVSEDNHGLKNVVITLVGVKGKVSVQDTPFTLDQTKCRYLPHVQAVPVGSMLEIKNDDGILHNVHVYLDGDLYADQLKPKATIFNKAQPKFRKKIKQKLDKPGMYFYRCDVHSHMSAFIAVMNQPYYDVTNDSGEFTIANVPPGTYKIQAWHEVLGKLEKDVVVESGKTAEVVFDILPNE